MTTIWEVNDAVSQPDLIHEVYLPFSEAQLAERFQFTQRRGKSDPVARYRESAARLADYFEAQDDGPVTPGDERRARQIEKDETFWTAACLMAFWDAEDRSDRIEALLTRAFGPSPPIRGLASWAACLDGEVELFLEVGLSSPRAYGDWIRDRVDDRNLVPYVKERAKRSRGRLEGRTHLDAMVLVPATGFAIHFEAKATSDTDSKVSYDLLRNQIARNVDAMLEPPASRTASPLSKRNPDRSLFVLLTPRMFKEAPWSRLYGWLMNEYMASPAALARDLPHRTEIRDWAPVSRRIGWLTWEDCDEALPGACRWLAAANQRPPAF